jgi:RecB family endonuclease NucS
MVTNAGRLDLLCRDTKGNYVVVELKRTLGTDQVAGQILRYMGCLIEEYGKDKVRGIIVVPRTDQALSYAAKAVPNLQVKQFKIQIV